MSVSSDTLPFDKRRNDKALLQTREAGRRVRPPAQPVPDLVEMNFLVFGEVVDLVLDEEVVERHAVEDVQFRPRQLTGPHAVHRRP
jgi:hypothetical protein